MKQKTQKTPKEKFEIPVPKRSDVMKVFQNAAKPEKELGAKRSPKKKRLK